MFFSSHLDPTPAPIAPAPVQNKRGGETVLLTAKPPLHAPAGTTLPGSRSNSNSVEMTFSADSKVPDSHLIPVFRRNAKWALLRLAARPATDKINPLECALTRKYRVLPGFGRNCPPITPLQSALTETASVTPLECALTQKPRGEGGLPGQVSFYNLPYILPSFVYSNSIVCKILREPPGWVTTLPTLELLPSSLAHAMIALRSKNTRHQPPVTTHEPHPLGGFPNFDFRISSFLTSLRPYFSIFRLRALCRRNPSRIEYHREYTP